MKMKKPKSKDEGHYFNNCLKDYENDNDTISYFI